MSSGLHLQHKLLIGFCDQRLVDIVSSYLLPAALLSICLLACVYVVTVDKLLE